MNNEFINLSKQLLSHPLHDDFLDLHLYTILIKFNLENQSAHDAFQLVKEMKEKAINIPQQDTFANNHRWINQVKPCHGSI